MLIIVNNRLTHERLGVADMNNTVIEKTLKDTLICWPKVTLNGAIVDARIVSPGETVFIRDNQEKYQAGHMAVMLKDKILFCSCEQFWKAAD